MSRKTRICIVSPNESGGGAEYQIAGLVGELERCGQYDIHYVARHIAPSLRRSYSIEKVGSGDSMPKFGYCMDARMLNSILWRIRPDIIYQRVACGYTGICAWYARRHRIPLVWHIAHDSDVTRKTLDTGRNIIRSFLEKRCVEYALRRADRIVVQSATQDQLMLRDYGRSADARVPNFHPEPEEIPDKSGPVTVLWIANLKKWKRPEVFVSAAEALRAHGDVRFVMVGAPAFGKGGAVWGENLLARIRASGNIEYVGEKTQDEVNRMLSRGHVFVNTSDHEGFPNTFIQAWMRQVPVVSLHVNPDGVLDSGDFGMHAGSEQKLVSCIEKLIVDEPLRSAMGERAERYAKTHHSMRNAADLVSVLDRARDVGGGE